MEQTPWLWNVAAAKLLFRNYQRQTGDFASSRYDRGRKYSSWSSDFMIKEMRNSQHVCRAILRCIWPFTLSLEVICTVTAGAGHFDARVITLPPEIAVLSVPRRHHLGISQKLTSWILSRCSRQVPWRLNLINLSLGVTECIFLTACDLLLK